MPKRIPRCRRGKELPMTGIAAFAVLVLATVLSAQELPRASYFFVHDKGFVNGRPNRDRSMLLVMQFMLSAGQPTGVRVIKNYRTQYGLRDEPKEREGDRNTPEGIYEVSYVKKHRPDDYTGPWFFLLTYPNQDDRRLNRTGGAVGIHGGPNRPTLGCIRLRDRERGGQGIIAIEDLRQYVEIGTPVISVPELQVWQRGNPGDVLNREVAEFYAHMLTTPLANEHVVRLVKAASIGSTEYLAERDAKLPETELVTVSSELNPFGEFTYRGYNLLDGDPATCWAEGARGDGVGEWVQLRFPTPKLVRRIRMINGYAKGPRWAQNNRVRRASIQLSEGSSFDWRLADSREWQEFVLPTPVVTRYVQVAIDAVYRGSRRDWNDTSISELAVDAEAPATGLTAGGAAGTAAPGRGTLIAQASSFLEGGGAASGYYAFNAIDGDPATCWSEGGDGVGVGEWLRIGFVQPRTLGQVKVINGYDKRQGRIDRWAQNARVKRATLRFSDGSTVRWNLTDTRGWQTLALPRPVTTSFVQFTIDEAHPGARWDDTSISEIAVTDAPAGVTATVASAAYMSAFAPPTVTASSTLDEATSNSFLPANVMDGDPTTCWSEGAPDPSGQWLRFDFPGERRIYRMRIINGYDKIAGSQDRWEQNSRVKDAVLRFSDGSEQAITLRDAREWQTVEIPNGKVTRSVQLTIRTAYPGGRWQDTSISEVEFGLTASGPGQTGEPVGGGEGTRMRTTARAAEGVTATASSTASDPDPTRFAAANLLDGNPATCWAEGVPTDGVGERTRLEFSTARHIRTVRIVAGWGKADLRAQYNRPKWLTIQLSDGTSYDWFLEDRDEWQAFRFPQPKTVFFFELIIRDVFRGNVPAQHTTCISEVAVE